LNHTDNTHDENTHHTIQPSTANRSDSSGPRVTRASGHSMIGTLLHTLNQQRKDIHQRDAALDAARAETDRLRIMLAATRRAYADLIAAGWATLGAAADGESDPLAYLTGELPTPPPGHPLAAGWPRHGRGWRP
jgi:hypothetical protein